jgi:hypothetical protein
MARSNGECPSLSANYQEANQLWFQVRGGCGPTAGMLINNYTVDRRTGDVTLWGDNPLPVADQTGQAFARQLVLQARKRILTTREARCLALEAARSLPNWSGSDAAISVELLGKAEYDRVEFSVQHRSSVRPSDSGRGLSVNLRTARVRDDETGRQMMSAGLGALTSKILERRAPIWLSDEDAISIAFQIPSVAAGVRGGCRLWAGGAFRSEETQVGLSCGGRQAEGATVVAVNLRTGKTIDANTGKSLESVEATRLARQILDKLEQRRSELRKELDSVCRPE